MARQKNRRAGRPPNTETRYRRIADDLRRRMDDGEWKPGEPLPAQRALADRYDVGQISIRWALKVLKDEGRVAPNPRRRLIVRSPTHAATVTRRLYLEVLNNRLDGSLRAAYFRELQRGIETASGERDASLLIASQAQFQYAVPPDALDLPLSGILLHGHFQPQVLERYEGMNVPVVLADHVPVTWKVHAVAVDNQGATEEATRRLIELGHHRIAFLRLLLAGGVRQVDPDSKERQTGYERALKSAGIRVERDLIVNVMLPDRINSPSIRNLMQRRPRPTAVVAVDIRRGQLMMRAAKAAGLSVPEDISIVCFQESNAEVPGVGGPRVNFAEIGKRAVEMLAEPRRPARVVRVPAVWVEGRTVGRSKGR
jgi:DNA-binding LacI/PurR family transcriptional regulator